MQADYQRQHTDPWLEASMALHQHKEAPGLAARAPVECSVGLGPVSWPLRCWGCLLQGMTPGDLSAGQVVTPQPSVPDLDMPLTFQTCNITLQKVIWLKIQKKITPILSYQLCVQKIDVMA